MPQSELVTTIIGSLAKAQSEFTIVKKTKKGMEGNRTFMYADLADVLNMIVPCLNKQGIFLSHPLVLEKDGEHLRQTTKVSLGDEFIQSDGIRLSSIQGAGKNLGLEVTYSRRIDNNAFFGIFPDDDLDAPDLTPPTGEKTTNPQGPKTSYGQSPKVNQIPAKPSNTARPGEFKDVLKNPGPELIKIPAIVTETTVGYQSPTVVVDLAKFGSGYPGKPPEIELTGYEKGKIDNISVVGGNPNPGTPGITDDDLPVMDGPLQDRSSWPTDVPEDVFDHRPLTAERYEQIQARLKELTENKVLPARKFREFLETRHQGKRAFDVPAFQWEETVKRIEDAVSTGQDAVKVLLGITKS